MQTCVKTVFPILALALSAGLACASGSSLEGVPTEVTLNATIRDFRGADEQGGHPDFETFAGSNPRIDLVAPTLSSDNKPRLSSRTGRYIIKNALSADGLIIHPDLVDTSSGDVQGQTEDRTDPQITSSDGFDQWYRDIPGTNMSKTIPLTLVRDENSPMFVFDSARHEPYKTIGGFFPIDKELFGNYACTAHNYHFTTELQADFVCETGKGHVFTFTGDDDVWVFINDRLVMDLGGLHPKREQSLELDKLDWLVNGEVYTLRIFHAERHTTQSNFRIATTILFRAVQPPATTGLWD
jgi:fibro-slime domain-containing protein